MNQGSVSTVDMSFILTQMAKTNEMVMRLTENVGQLSGVSLRLDEAIEENERLKQTMTQQKEMLMEMNNKINSLSTPTTTQDRQEMDQVSQRGGRRTRVFDRSSDRVGRSPKGIYRRYELSIRSNSIEKE